MDQKGWLARFVKCLFHVYILLITTATILARAGKSSSSNIVHFANHLHDEVLT